MKTSLSVPVRDARGFTLIELLVVVGIIGIIAAIAVPQLLSARRSGNHASAVASLRAVSSAQRAYSSSCAQGAFATTLPQLGLPPTAGGTPFISPDLSTAAQVTKSGYLVEVQGGADGVPGSATACNGVPAAELSSSFYATANPVAPGSTGTWHFWLGASGTIFQDASPIGETDGYSSDPGGQPIQ